MHISSSPYDHKILDYIVKTDKIYVFNKNVHCVAVKNIKFVFNKNINFIYLYNNII